MRSSDVWVGYTCPGCTGDWLLSPSHPARKPCPRRSCCMRSWYSRCAMRLAFVDEFAIIEALPVACIVVPAIVLLAIKLVRDALKCLQGVQRARRRSRALSIGSGSTHGVTSPVSQLSPLAAAGVTTPDTRTASPSKVCVHGKH